MRASRYLQLLPVMVNTFLVIADYAVNATFLDSRRLGKQRVEAMQIINAIEKGSGGWVNHPVSRAWANHVPSLKQYYNCILDEWLKRGYKNTMTYYTELGDVVHPPWVSEPRIQYAMMAQLIQKNSDYYSVASLTPLISPELLTHFKSFPLEYLDYGYIWPAKHTLEDIQTKPLSEIAEPFELRVFCIHAKCHNKALYGQHCGVHRDKSIVIGKCTAHYKNGLSCRNNAKYGEEKCGIHNRN